MIPIPPSTTHTSREKPSYAPGVGENILGVFLAYALGVGENILEVFSSVRPGSRGKYIFSFFSPTLRVPFDKDFTNELISHSHMLVHT